MSGEASRAGLRCGHPLLTGERRPAREVVKFSAMRRCA
jgi:hypothetical protein